MSSLRIFCRTSQKDTPQEETENGSKKPSDSNFSSTTMASSMRAPLCPISEQQQKLAGLCIENFSNSQRFYGTRSKTKGKGCGKADDSELPPFTSPKKNGFVPSSTTNVNNRNRFGWAQRHETNITNGIANHLDNSQPPTCLSYSSVYDSVGVFVVLLRYMLCHLRVW